MFSDAKRLFNLPDDVAYLNCAYMGPLLKTSAKAGRQMMERLSQPYTIFSEDFFVHADRLRTLYAELIHCPDAERIALMPSSSYAMANVIRQIRPVRGSNVVMANGEFPSSVHGWRRLCNDFDCDLRLIESPLPPPKRARAWHEALLNSIDDKTAAVIAAPLHWSDGSRFKLGDIRDKCRQHNALFIVDGSQWIGAAPFDVEDLQADAVVNAGYKWMFSPYGASYAYYGPFFDDGIPIEENWISHEDNRDFSKLVNANPNLVSKASRYSAGQHPSMVYVAMQTAAIEQILEWGPANIQQHCRDLYAVLASKIVGLSEHVEQDDWRAKHLFGIYFKKSVDVAGLKRQLDEQKLYLSHRGNALRISLHVWNTVKEMERLGRAIGGVV